MDRRGLLQSSGVHGLTLLEVLLAMFIFMVGVIGLLAALPVGIASAELVILQDTAINLSSSKFAEFRRDNINPANDLIDSSSYMASHHEALNSTGYRSFAHGPGERYEHYADIERYEWQVEQACLLPVGLGADDLGQAAPVESGGQTLPVTRVTLVIRLKGTNRNFRFTQYMVQQ